MIGTIKRQASTQILLQFPALAQLAPESLHRLAAASAVEELPAGRLLFKPGTREQQRLYLLAGEVALVSDSQAVGNIVAGSEDASRELAPERPRRLWGWSRSRVEILWVDASLADSLKAQTNDGVDTAGAAADREPPAAQPADELIALRQALHQAQQDRRETVDELRRVRDELAVLQTELTRSREQLHQAEAALAVQSSPVSLPQERTVEDAARTPDPVTTPPVVPSLRLDPNERVALAPTEIDEVMDSWTLEVPPDVRRRSRHP